jgi:hypothetical protein
LFLDLLGLRHVLDNRFPVTLPLSPPSSISGEVVSISVELSRDASRSLSVLVFEVV